MNYVALTHCMNEEKLIGNTIESVLNQTVKPQSYVVVDDGSTDATPDIIKQYPVEYRRITAPKLPYKTQNLFRAFILGANEAIKTCPEWEYLFSIDADSAIPPDYVESLMKRTEADPRIGIASGVMHGRRLFKTRPSNGARLWKKGCWVDIGGIDPIIHFDMHAVLKANQKGWKTRAFNDIKYSEYRTSKRRNLMDWYISGRTRHVLGFPIPHSCGISIIYMNDKPYILGALVMLLTHFLSGVATPKPFNDEYYDFMKKFAIWELFERLGRNRL